jgi:hypothetical protein
MTLDDYIKAMGLTASWFTFDGGRTLYIRRGRFLVWHGTYEWGEEDSFFRAVRKHLDALPWTCEDDPRVKGEY